jgi:hypothetical protein
VAVWCAERLKAYAHSVSMSPCSTFRIMEDAETLLPSGSVTIWNSWAGLYDARGLASAIVCGSVSAGAPGVSGGRRRSPATVSPPRNRSKRRWLRR